MTRWLIGVSLGVGAVWLLWGIWVWNLLHRRPADPVIDEEARRRHALGRVTQLEAHRGLARHDPDRSARWAARRQ